MAIEDLLKNDLIAAMKSKDQETLTTIRMLKAAIDNKKIENKSDAITDEQIIPIIQKQAKQRKESHDSFIKAGRTELAQKEEREYKILEKYLPAQLTPEALKALIQEAIKETGAQSKADMGKVIKATMDKVKGQADGKTVSGLVAELLG